MIILQNINDILDDWKDIHKNTRRCLALCYNVSIIEVIKIASVLEVLPIAVEIEKETFIDNSVPYAWSSWFYR